MKPHTLTLAAAAAFLFARLAAGQQTDSDNYKFTVHSNLVLLPTRVQTKTGETIYGIKPEQFLVEDKNSSPPPVPDPVYLDHAPLFEWPAQLLLVINALRRDSASELASLSGGEYFSFTNRRGFEQDLERISNQIHNYYLLRYQPSGPIMILHTLRVRVDGYPNAVIQTRRNYWSGIFESSTGNGR